LPQVALGREDGILKGVRELNASRLGVVADVIRGGAVQESDPIRVVTSAHDAG